MPGSAGRPGERRESAGPPRPPLAAASRAAVRGASGLPGPGPAPGCCGRGCFINTGGFLQSQGQAGRGCEQPDPVNGAPAPRRGWAGWALKAPSHPNHSVNHPQRCQVWGPRTPPLYPAPGLRGKGPAASAPRPVPNPTGAEAGRPRGRPGGGRAARPGVASGRLLRRGWVARGDVPAPLRRPAPAALPAGPGRRSRSRPPEEQAKLRGCRCAPRALDPPGRAAGVAVPGAGWAPGAPRHFSNKVRFHTAVTEFHTRAQRLLVVPEHGSRAHILQISNL